MKNPDDNFISNVVDTYLNKFDGYIPETDEEDDYDYTIEVQNSVQNPVIYSDFFDFSSSTNFITSSTNYVTGYQDNVDGHTVNNFNMTNLGWFESAITFTNNSGVDLELNYKIQFFVVDDLSLTASPTIEGTTGVVPTGQSVTITENTSDYISEYPNSDNLSMFTTVPFFQFWIDDGNPKENAQNWKGARAGKQGEKVFFDWRRAYGTWEDDSTVYPQYEADGYVPNTGKQILTMYPMGSQAEAEVINSLVSTYNNGKDLISTFVKIIFYIALFFVLTILILTISIIIYFISYSILDYKNKKQKVLIQAEAIEEIENNEDDPIDFIENNDDENINEESNNNEDINTE